MCFLLLWQDGRVWQVPVDPCDPDQFTWFADGKSEPPEQLCLWSPRPPLQPASQLQLEQPVVPLPGDLSSCLSSGFYFCKSDK